MFLYVSKQTFRKLYGYITRELLGLSIRNFQGISLHEHKHIGRLSNLHWCTFKSTKSQKYYKNLTDINPLSAKLTTWPNTLKQFVGNLPTNCLSAFDHFVILTLKRIIIIFILLCTRFCINNKSQPTDYLTHFPDMPFFTYNPNGGIYFKGQIIDMKLTTNRSSHS